MKIIFVPKSHTISSITTAFLLILVSYLAGFTSQIRALASFLAILIAFEAVFEISNSKNNQKGGKEHGRRKRKNKV